MHRPRPPSNGQAGRLNHILRPRLDSRGLRQNEPPDVRVPPDETGWHGAERSGAAMLTLVERFAGCRLRTLSQREFPELFPELAAPGGKLLVP